MGTLREDLRTFIAMAPWFVLNIRKILDKVRRVNPSTRCMFHFFPTEMVSFMRHAKKPQIHCCVLLQQCSC